MEISLFGTQAVVVDPQNAANLFQKSRLWRGREVDGPGSERIKGRRVIGHAVLVGQELLTRVLTLMSRAFTELLNRWRERVSQSRSADSVRS